MLTFHSDGHHRAPLDPNIRLGSIIVFDGHTWRFYSVRKNAGWAGSNE